MTEATSSEATGESTEAGGPVPRRQALCGILALGILGPTALAACSSGQQQYGSGTATGTGAYPTNPGQPSNGAVPLPSGAPSGATGGGAVLAQASQIPVGGGVIATAPDGRQIVVARSEPTKIQAFDASCTHAGTPVGAPVQGVMTCPNHGSKFDAKGGAVISGPASSPLKGVAIALQGDNIVLA